MELQPGGIVSHYRIVEKLGAGGMGVVYKAEDTRLGRFVALKFLPVEFARDPQALERFKREARAASALDNPNICTIHDIDEFEGQPFIVMQLLDGQTLARKVSGKPLKLVELIDIGIQVGDALAAAHEHGIVHRDIKPTNIVVTKSGQAKILDFGVAKSATPDNAALSEAPTINQGTLTNPGTAVGTVAYMSPEQARGEDVDARTDLFSFGAVLYEMATGRQAFSGPTTAVVFDSILRGPTPSAAQLNPEVSRNLEEIIARSLEKDPRLRYQTATDMRADLQRALRDYTEATRVVGMERGADSAPVRASRGTKVIVTLGVFALALFLLLELSLYFLRGSMQPIDSLAVLPFINGSADPDTTYLSEGISESIMNSLSQLPSLRLMSSNSVARYRGPSIDARAAGVELGVRAVLTGRVLLRGDDLSVQTELVNVRDNSRLWGEQYNRKRADVLSVQEDIAKQISSALRLRLNRTPGRSLRRFAG
jgi:non-specific serine/threonine protein kinase